MHKISFILLFLVFSSGVFSQNNHTMNKDAYANEWATVAEFEKKSLPQSALETVHNILHKAIKDKNSPQVIKALIHQGKYDLVKDAENDTLIFRNLNEMVKKSGDVVEKSVLHSMLGELYLQYYQKDSWNIDQRTALGDFVPADMKEWTRNIFYDKAAEHLAASVAAEEELVKAKVESYATVVGLGKDSRRFFPTMYDFLARRAIELFAPIGSGEEVSRLVLRKNIPLESLFAPADQFVMLPFDLQQGEYALWPLVYYKRLLASLQQRGMDGSLLLVELEKSDYLKNMFYALHASLARPLMEELLTKWDGNEMSVEIIDKLSEFYLQEIGKMSSQDSIQRKEKTRELYELLQKTIVDFPKYERILILQNKLLQLTQPSFTVTGANTFSKRGDKELKVNFQNIQSLTAKLYRISSPTDVLEEKSRYGREVIGERLFVKDIPISLPDLPAYWSGEASLSIEHDQLGTYLLIFSSSPESKKEQDAEYYFSVSDLTTFVRSVSENRYHFFVVDRTTGMPVPNAKVDIYKLPGNWNNSRLTLDQSITTDKLGLALYDKKIPNRDVYFHAVSGEDRGAMLTQLPWGYPGYNMGERKSWETAEIYTDRMLYRPGQTVYFKVISIRKGGDENDAIIAGKSIDLVLWDANGQEVSRKKMTTNEFGSAAGEFVLPQALLPGNFRLDVAGENSAYFQVEEYKRPTFELTFSKIEGSYQFGEEIRLKGKAESFSGITLQQANVEYQVVRRQMWWRMPSRETDYYAAGSVITAEDGSFEISFTPEKPQGHHLSSVMYAFEVQATMTDNNGETQTAIYVVKVGDNSMRLSLKMADRWAKESEEEIVVSAQNLDGKDVAADGIYQIFSLQEDDSMNRLVVEGRFATGEQPALRKQLSDLPSGKYKVKLESKDDSGNLIEEEKNIILFSYFDKRPPVKTNDWFIVKNALFSQEKNPEVIFGVSEKVHLLYELWQGDNLLEREWIEMKNENRLFSFPYKEKYKNGVSLMLTYVKDGKFYNHQIDFRGERKKEDLKVSLDLFRDRIRPGAEEEWRITVTGSDGNPAIAEILASMYDFSLDNIHPSREWNLFTSSAPQYYLRVRQGSDQSFKREMVHSNIPVQWRIVDHFEYDHFNWFGYSMQYSSRVLFRAQSPGNQMLYGSTAPKGITAAGDLSKRAANDLIEVVEKKAETEELFVTRDSEEMGIPLSPSGWEGPQSQPLQLRRNFNETAFFFPHLSTNDKGETQIAFTVPESNTKWRFRLLAHDKQLNVGKAEAFAISQKELMVTPNMPRFLRHGDRAAISTKISNLSEGAIHGSVKMEFFNPVTEEMMAHISLENQEQPFSLEQGASSHVWWMFDLPADIDILGVRIVAQSENFSDGEQHALAVLPNRMLVTESMRMDLSGGETKEFAMERLVDKSSPTMQDYRLTLEFTSNPAWYAVQALPVLGEPDSDNAVSWFASYYANALGAHIGNAFPKVKAMVEAWKKKGGSKETFVANLEKNQELKTILLEETPWVLEAKNESEQKERLSLLFDLNRSRNLRSTAMSKLQDLQTNEGGWSWFKGFYSSVGITQYILNGFHQLKELGIAEFSKEILSMQERALSYIDAEARNRFEAMKRHNKEWKNIKTISSIDLEYLYVRSGYRRQPLSGEIKEMTDLYLSVIEKNWTQYGLYERSLIAILMSRQDKSAVVETILNSFREHATRSEEMGMYWVNNRAGVFMSQSAVSVHTFIMDAFRVGGAETREMDEMKRWLLKQKQTQLWETTHATADAVNALLRTGSDWFGAEGETSVTLGTLQVEPESKESGSGYFKESWSPAEIEPEMGRVTVVHQGNTPAWGALYWQYFEELEKIEKTDASLDIEKQLFVEQNTPSGTQLVRITEENPLKVGDKVVVRLTVRSDRNMEFVHLKDMRAATFEPVDQISQMVWQNGLLYYQTSKDASTNFYFDNLPRGTYLFEYAVYVSRLGSYSNGITTIQSIYAPEFTSHTAGMKIIVKE